MRKTVLTAAVVLTAALGACRAESDDTARRSEAPARGVEPGGMMGEDMADMHRRMMGGAGSAPEAEAEAASAAECPDIDQALVDRGREAFNGAGGCTACHGSDATGSALAAVIRTGVPEPKQYSAPMPPKGGASLSDAQVCAVAAYVYSLSR